jgi:hypothetical protein
VSRDDDDDEYTITAPLLERTGDSNEDVEAACSSSNQPAVTMRTIYNRRTSNSRNGTLPQAPVATTDSALDTRRRLDHIEQ